MISRNLWHRLKQLEDKIKTRCEPQATPNSCKCFRGSMRRDGAWR